MVSHTDNRYIKIKQTQDTNTKYNARICTSTHETEMLRLGEQ